VANSSAAQGFQEAQRFLADALKKPDMVDGYVAAGEQALSQGNNQPITDYLSKAGYQTDATQIFQAKENQSDTNLAAWAGIYGTAYLTDSAKKVTAGPPLVVFANGTAAINGEPIAGLSFSSATLSWTNASNPTQGSVKFYEQSPDEAAQGGNATGPTKNFYGTIVLQKGGTTLTYSGTIGPVTAFPLEHWSGRYTQTYVQPTGGAAAAGPALVVQDAATVTLGGIAIKGFAYSNVGNALSWDMTGGNTTAGSIKFTKITTPAGGSTYVGPFFIGTLTQT
jgi:hypothetical protein